MRPRTLNNENDENAAPSRLTRAKAAAMGGNDEVSGDALQKPLQTKKCPSTTLSGAPGQKKRAALGDLSNVVKNENVEKGIKKAAAATRPAPASKAPSGGVQKVSRSSSTRSALGPKAVNEKRSSGSDLKRPASGAGLGDRAQNKRSTSSAQSQNVLKDARPDIDADLGKQELRQATVAVEERTHVEKRETIRVEDVAPEVMPEEEDAQAEIGVPDLDADDVDDPIMVAEYAAEIFDYLRDLEESSRPNPSYMDHQDYVDWKDRDVLNDWLVEVHARFQLLPETFYLAINIVDRFLSQKIVQLDKLQLVGITALFIASKYEEIISPHVTNFTYVAKDYEDADILSAERFMLAALNYDLSYPNPMNFLRRISKADNYDIQTRTLAKYLLEISAVDHRFLVFPPSHTAAAAMYMARKIMNRGAWVCLTKPITGRD